MSSLLLNIMQTGKNIELNSLNEKYESEISPTYNYLDSLTVRSFENKVKSGEQVIVYIGRPDCNDCIIFEPILEYVIDNYDLSKKIKFVNVKKFRSENEERWIEFKEKYSFSQTPAFLMFDNGEYVSGIEWGKDGLPVEHLINWLQKNNIVEH